MSLLVENVTSPSRIAYPRDFLLRYQNTVKEEPTITEKLKPYLSPPHKTKRTTPIKKEAPSPFILKPKNEQTPIERGPKHPKKRNTPKDASNQKGADKENAQRQKNVPRTDTKRIPLAPILTPVQQVSPFIRVASNNPRFTLETPKTKPLTPINVHQSPLSPSLPYVPPMLVPRASSLPEIEVTDAGSLSAKASANPLYKKPAMMSAKKIPAHPVRNLASSHPTPKTNSTSTPMSQTVKSNGTPTSSRRTPSPLDSHRISQRQKQINYGHNTVGYLRYMLMVPRECRKPENPRTPKKEQACSKRSWDGQLKKWRRELHLWDPEDPEAFKAMLESDLVNSMLQSSVELMRIYENVKDKIGKESSDEEDEGKLEEENADEEEKPDADEKEVNRCSSPSRGLPSLPEVINTLQESAIIHELTASQQVEHVQPVARTLVF